MNALDRLPALPLIASDPYLSIWMPADTLTEAHTCHWCGLLKPLIGEALIAGKRYRFLGRTSAPALRTISQRVTPTATISVQEGAGIELTLTFRTAALPNDLDALSTPITTIDFTVRSSDGQPHAVEVQFSASDSLCYDGNVVPEMIFDAYKIDGLNIAYTGQSKQAPLSNSGDNITIDWGYLYLASAQSVFHRDHALRLNWSITATPEPQSAFALLGYDDIASINYFGTLCKAWYMRNGRTIVDALRDFSARHDALAAACIALATLSPAGTGTLAVAVVPFCNSTVVPG
jgi:hypothetical protein